MTILIIRTTVGSVMVPRERIAFFQTGKSNGENFEVTATTLHTRFPVSESDTVDGIIGYVNFKELVSSAPSRRGVRMPQFIRPVARIRQDADLNNVLKVLLGRRGHMIMVEDERGRLVGLVTLEDVLEQILGEHQDEFDTALAELIQEAPNRWKAEGLFRCAFFPRSSTFPWFLMSLIKSYPSGCRSACGTSLPPVRLCVTTVPPLPSFKYAGIKPIGF